MDIAILSRSQKIYSTRRLIEAAKARQHRVTLINTLRCYMSIATQDASIHYKGKQLPDVDAVIPRFGASNTFYGTAVVRQFEMRGTFCLNESIAINKARDKLRCFQLLSKKGVGLPVTGFAHSPDDVQDLIKMVGGAPLVIKLLEGTQGIGVVLAETPKAAESVIDAFFDLKAHILVQEYIKEAQGTDIRCFVIGNEVVASMKRTAKPGEFRSNIHRGGRGEIVAISDEERATALRAANIVGLELAGVDILRSRNGPLVMEVNASPGLEGIEKVTGINIADLVIEYVENRRLAPKKRRFHMPG